MCSAAALRSSALMTIGARRRPTASSGQAATSCACRCAGRWPTDSTSKPTQYLQASGGTAQPIAHLGSIDSLRGLHNAQNAACATGAALALGLDAQAIQRGLRSFPGLAHRMEQVGRKGAVLFVNDSKATNADAAARALACFADIFWIAGGKPKTGGITSLTGFFPRIRKAYLIGEAAEEFAATLAGCRRARGRRHARSRCRAGGPRCRGVGRAAAGGAALARLRLIRPVPQFRGARRQIPRPGARVAGRLLRILIPWKPWWSQD